ncbi:response regulator transcription factor [Flavobacteriaceae bacterium TP-CH-4]|uniref:Response regulator transcription factor n=1 Tax=Pelagihabitans pacificus TaxID=2696054 RepID=A0A967E667_9FLAO|nr:response regulator transcription factor [Pelagihabitans pacificus]NHF60182.1 response regulator transcription factor [Pelagihabitans pacificus]
MTKYLIIDDEPIAHEIIRSYCDKMNNMKLMKSCYDAIEALDYMRENEIDLIFLDINMPKLKGFEFLRTLSRPPKVIVTTAYQEYALEGYTLDVVDYLLKPFSFERFLKAFNKATKSNSMITNNIKSDKQSDFMFIYANKTHTQINVNDISHIEAAGNYVKIYTASETFTIRDKISTIIQRLSKNKFIQVHKSFVVSIQHISSIEGNRIKISDYFVPIGKSYKNEINNLVK